MTHLATVRIENGVYLNGRMITVVRDGRVEREYCTPRNGQYVRYWQGEGNDCNAKQEFCYGSTGSSG